MAAVRMRRRRSAIVRMCPPHGSTHAQTRGRWRRKPPSPEVEVRLAVSQKMAAAGPAPGAVDELVSSVTLYRRRPRLLHGTVLPFVAGLYPAWLWLWGPRVWAAWAEAAAAAEEEEGPKPGPGPAPPEAAFLALAAIGVVQLLTALSGLWSVHAHCALTCVRVSPGSAGAAGPATLGTPPSSVGRLLPLAAASPAGRGCGGGGCCLRRGSSGIGSSAAAVRARGGREMLHLEPGLSGRGAGAHPQAVSGSPAPHLPSGSLG